MQAFIDANLATLPPVELGAGSHFDLSRRSTQRAILSWLHSGLIWYIHIALPCAALLVWVMCMPGIMVRALQPTRSTSPGQWSRAPETLLSFPPVINGGTLSCLLGTLIIPFFLDSTCFLWLPFGDVSITLLLLF